MRVKGTYFCVCTSYIFYLSVSFSVLNLSQMISQALDSTAGQFLFMA